MENKLKIASFFAGVGGIDLGFRQAGAETVYANEYNSGSVKTFELNFPLKADSRDIHDVKPDEVPDADIICGGFPCQAFSIAGYQEGFQDKKGRGTLFFELLRIIREKQPKAVFCENVRNLVSHNSGKTFRVIQKSLEGAGYYCTYKILNTSTYGNLPQNRERVYLVGFRSLKALEHFAFPEQIPLTASLADVIDFETKLHDKYYYTAGKYKTPVYEKIQEIADDADAVYQYRKTYARKIKSGLIPTLTANMGEGGHNVPIVCTKYGFRKMTPRECFNAQGFPETYLLPDDLAESKLYQQAGNSVSVNVIYRIAENMIKAMQKG